MTECWNASPGSGWPPSKAMAGWVGEGLERLDYRFKYMGHMSKMKRPASEYFARNIWISADPEERMLPLMIEFASPDRFFIGSDYPHAEGFVSPVAKTRGGCTPSWRLRFRGCSTTTL